MFLRFSIAPCNNLCKRLYPLSDGVPSDEAHCCTPDSHRARLAEAVEHSDLIVTVRTGQALLGRNPMHKEQSWLSEQ